MLKFLRQMFFKIHKFTNFILWGPWVDNLKDPDFKKIFKNLKKKK